MISTTAQLNSVRKELSNGVKVEGKDRRTSGRLSPLGEVGSGGIISFPRFHGDKVMTAIS